MPRATKREEETIDTVTSGIVSLLAWGGKNIRKEIYRQEELDHARIVAMTHGKTSNGRKFIYASAAGGSLSGDSIEIIYTKDDGDDRLEVRTRHAGNVWMLSTITATRGRFDRDWKIIEVSSKTSNDQESGHAVIPPV